MGIGASKSDRTEQTQQQVDAHPLVEATMQQVLGEGQRMLGGIPGSPEFFGGDTVANLDPYQRAALDEIAQRGFSGSDADQALRDFVTGQLGADYASGIQAGAGDLMGGIDPAQDALSRLASGGISLGDAASFAGGGTSPYDQALEAQASGRINPLTGAMYREAASNLNEAFQEGVVPGINATFGGAGRTGGGLHGTALTNAAGELADAQGELAANMFGGAAESALGRQLAAAQGGLGNELGERNLAASLFEGGANRGLTAANALQGGGIAGLGALGQLFGGQQGAGQLAGLANQIDFGNLNQLLGAGGLLQDQAQREIEGARERHEYNASIPLQDFERRLASLGGVTGLTGGLAGTGSTTGEAQQEGFRSGMKKGNV